MTLEPCQFCGAIEHPQPTQCYGFDSCPHCGGIHFGSFYCPYTVKEKKMSGATDPKYAGESMNQQMGQPVAEAQRELPRYKCHKEVWALKIKAVDFDYEAASQMNRETDGSATITPAEEGYAPFKVSQEYVSKHFRFLPRPQIVGGYYVLYSDGYQSFSPARAFEEGYTRA